MHVKWGFRKLRWFRFFARKPIRSCLSSNWVQLLPNTTQNGEAGRSPRLYESIRWWIQLRFRKRQRSIFACLYSFLLGARFFTSFHEGERNNARPSPIQLSLLLPLLFVLLFVAFVIFSSKTAQKSHVKSQNHLTPSHPITSTVKFSYLHSAILKTVEKNKKAPQGHSSLRG